MHEMLFDKIRCLDLERVDDAGAEKQKAGQVDSEAPVNVTR